MSPTAEHRPGGAGTGLASKAQGHSTSVDPGEGKYRRAAHQWRQLFDALTDPVCVVTREGRVQRCNQALARLLGRTFPETLGHNLADLFLGAPEQNQLSLQLGSFLDDGSSGEFVQRIKDRWFRVKVDALRNLAGGPGAVCILRDVTQRRGAEEALRRNLAFEEAVIEATPSLVIAADEDGVVSLFNATAAELTAFDADEVLGRSLVGTLVDEERWSQLRELAEAPTPMQYEVPCDVSLQTKTGRQLLVEWRAHLLTGHAKGRCHYVFSGNDVTAKRRVEEHLNQTEKLSALGELIAGVAHELNNPLAGVIGYAELMLAAKGTPSGLKNDLETIDKCARRCKSIVDNMLRFARQQKPEKKPLLIQTVIDDALDLMAYQLRVSNITVKKDYGRAIPAASGDAAQLSQVMVNLINNARQEMYRADSRGVLTVRTRHKRGVIRVSCSDTGPGIPKSHLSRIFDPFYTTKEVGTGTGLGLSVCFGIITTHRGRIWAESEEGEGATFVFELPVPPLGPVESAVSERKKAVVKRLRQRILVVDDEPMVLDVLNRMLTSLGFIVDVASSGQSALEAIREQCFDLIVSDCRMPGISGEELHSSAMALRPELKDRFVFCTGDTVSRGTREFFKSANCPVVAKPFNFTDLANTLAEMQERLVDGRPR